ncbi:MAG TPA: hypothetical protein VF720_16595 [Candidatus Eisenbacteria bacterium]
MLRMTRSSFLLRFLFPALVIPAVQVSAANALGPWSPGVVDHWGSEGTGPGQFGLAHGLAVGPDGSVYVGDTLNNRVQKFTADGDYVLEFAVAFPGGVDVDDAGNVFVVGGTDQVFKFSSTGEPITSWGGTGSDPGQFRFPLDVAVDSQGFVYVVDWMNHRVQKFTNDGGFVLAFGSEGTGDGQFMTPVSIVCTGSDVITVHVVDMGLDRTVAFLGNGEWTGGLPGDLHDPTGIALEHTGYLLLLDAGSGRIHVYGPGGEFQFAFGSEGNELGQFFHPSAIDAGPDGRIYVMDKDNHRVQVFQSIASPIVPATWSGIKSLSAR